MNKKLLCLVLFTILFGVVEAQAVDATWMRAAFCDTRYPAAWAGVGTGTRDALVAAGYTALNADELKTWMNDRIKDKKLSVVVFCQDVVPDTVVESQADTCTLRKYLNAGGKIVWYGDIPFYYWGHATGAMDTWGDAGAPAVLGFNTSSAPRDTNQQPRFTAAGIKWGLTLGWTSQRPLQPSVTTNVTVLATDGSGAAPAWVKHYKAGDKSCGFVRFRDTGGQADVGDIMRLAEFMNIKASNPSPANGATGVTDAYLKWDPSSFATKHDIYLGTSPNLGPADKKKTNSVTQTTYILSGLEPGVTYYWRIDEIESDATIRAGDVWSFTTAPTNAFAPVPRDGDKWIDPNANLSWQAGQDAMEHALYFGTDKAAVEARDASVSKGTMFELTFDPGLLALQTTYYWVVDETDTGYPGQVWSFTTTNGGGGVKAEYFGNTSLAGAPFLTLIEPAIDHSWGNGGPTATVIDTFSARYTADLEVIFADTYTFIGTSDDGIRAWLNDKPLFTGSWVDRGTTDSFSAAMPLQPGINALVVEYYENTGGAVCQFSWQTPNMARQIIPAGPLQPPVRAKPIYPQTGDANIPQDVTLMWSAGEKAVKHEVYFGTDKAAVEAATTADAPYKGSQAKDENTFVPGALEWNKTYYWRVDEVNTANADSPWKGSVWSFTTADFIVVDDFESYNNDLTNRIFQSWIDGWGYTEPAPGNPGNGTSSTVGYSDPALPFGERSIIHGGIQSMPFDYNNIVSPYYSETDRTFTDARNWKVNGVTTLVVWYQGYGARFVDDGTTITMSAAGDDIWNNADAFRFAYKKINGDGSITAKVNSIVQTDAWAKAGVMIRETLTPGSANVANVVSAASGVSFQYRNFTDDVSANYGTGSLKAPYWVRLTRTGNTFKAEMSADGKTWASVAADPANTVHDVTIGSSVYIGLCVTSHNTNAKLATTGVFSDIKTTGSVTGSWQVADIGSIVHPGNDADTLYVALQDSAGKIAVVPNDDPKAVLSSTWTPWQIPLTKFTGVNLGSVKKMYIGVGSRSAPKASGHGMLFIDDVRVIK